MRQHHKKFNGSCKKNRRAIRAEGLKILATMDKPVGDDGEKIPYTKAIRRKQFVEARKQAKRNMK